MRCLTDPAPGLSGAGAAKSTASRLAQTCAVSLVRVSGVILTSGQPPEALVNKCVQQHIPVVGINRQPTIPGVDYVCSDNAAGAELAADQLLRSGCQRFGWLNHHPSTWAGRMRGEASGRALQTRGVDVERHLAILACQQEGYAGGLQAAALADEALEISAPTPSLPVAFSMECASAAERLRQISADWF